MKNTIICGFTMAGLLVSTVSPALGENVLYRDLPDHIRKSMQKHRDDLDRIESFNYNGKTVYEVQLEKGGFLYFGDDGSRLTDPSLRNHRLSSTGNLKLNNLPAPVQKTFRAEAGVAKVSRIYLDTQDGKTIYDIEYTQGGQTDEIRINQDGTLARLDQRSTRDQRQSRNQYETQRDRRDRENRESREQRENRESSDNRDRGQVVAGFDRPMAATQKVDFESVPEAVKRTVRDVAGSNRIEDAERGRLDGKTVYEIAFKKDGEHNELRVAEDGSIVQRVAARNIRFPGALSVNEVPDPVRRAIRDQVGSGEVNDIDKKTVSGRTVYEVGFKKESGGVQHEIQIAEDGTVIGEPAGARND